jgi:hypothetical protein
MHPPHRYLGMMHHANSYHRIVRSNKCKWEGLSGFRSKQQATTRACCSINGSGSTTEIGSARFECCARLDSAGRRPIERIKHKVKRAKNKHTTILDDIEPYTIDKIWFVALFKHLVRGKYNVTALLAARLHIVAPSVAGRRKFACYLHLTGTHFLCGTSHICMNFGIKIQIAGVCPECVEGGGRVGEGV